MTQRKHDAHEALRRAIHDHGAKSDETRSAAIAFCEVHGMDPYFRYAVYPKMVAPTPESWDKPMRDEAVYAVYEWERVLARVIKDDA